jgi:hypothetical protein
MAFCVMRAVHDSIWESTGSSLQSRKAPKGNDMSDQDDWDFAGADDAKATIRAAVRYLLKGAAGSDRGDIAREIIEIVNEVARGLPPGDPFDDELPGG